MSDLKTIRSTLDKEKGKREQLTKDVMTLKRELKFKGREQRLNEAALEIVKEVGIKTMDQLRFHISDMTSMAMEAVFENPYKLVVDFVERRNKMECDLLFERDGNLIEPKDSSGGGAQDISAFALRIASHSMERPRSNNVLILDEPFHWLSDDNQEKASMMLKEISKKLSVQFIVVTHKPALAAHADRTFTTTLKKGVTKVTCF